MSSSLHVTGVDGTTGHRSGSVGIKVHGEVGGTRLGGKGTTVSSKSWSSCVVNKDRYDRDNLTGQMDLPLGCHEDGWTGS